MSELSAAVRLTSSRFPTCVQKVDYPFHQGKPNSKHGKFFFVGAIPSACYDPERQGSKFYDTEQAAIDAAIAAGAERIQGVD